MIKLNNSPIVAQTLASFMAISGGGDTGDSHTCLVTMGDTDTEEEEWEDALEHAQDHSRGGVDVQKVERVLELRRRVTLAVILVIFIISIGFIAFSVIVDLKAQKSKLKLKIFNYGFIYW